MRENRELKLPGRWASTLFSAFCLSGILTMLSQVETAPPWSPDSTDAEQTTLDPSAPVSGATIDEVFPAAIRQGALIQLPGGGGSERAEPLRLHLR
ncbi:MAG: hypothetical protein HY721_28435 [Planctomycetes bacterium]|nr:hypothetical protein [Planctomycetota bacterium]